MIFRRTIFTKIFLTPLLLFAPLAAQTSDEPEAPKIAISDEILQKIPSGYREEVVHLHLTAARSDQDKILKQTAMYPDAALALALRGMSINPEGFDFMMLQLTKEPSAERRSLILKYGIEPHVRYANDGEQGNRVRELLMKLVLQDPSSDVSLEAVQALRRLDWGHSSQLIVARAGRARAENDMTGAMKLLDEGDQWIGWDEQINIPNFLRTAPPVFSVVPENKSIRVLAFGDFGTGSPQQLQVAAAMREYHRKSPFDFGITLGDNFYPNGVSSPDDPQWKAKWEDLYGPLGLSFYATLGNHDYIRADGPAAEILHTQKSPTWKMPATYYTYTAGPVQFFAIDTIELSDSPLPNKELAWLDAELVKSKAKWKIVYGHYQIYSATRGDEQNLIKRLLPVMRNRVDVYLCGHDHNLQELKPEDGVHFFVSGGGGAGSYPFRFPDYRHSVFKQEQYGFTVLDADNEQLRMQFIDLNGKELYSSVIRK
jgi:tartrate-resistant acid phosphatase type 5